MALTREFRLLAAGQALSWLGTGFQTVALAVAVVGNGGSAGDLGPVLACHDRRPAAFTLFGGVWADRVQPQRAMALADIVRFVHRRRHGADVRGREPLAAAAVRPRRGRLRRPGRSSSRR